MNRKCVENLKNCLHLHLSSCLRKNVKWNFEPLLHSRDEKSPLRNRIAKHYQDEDETSFNNGEKYKFSLHNSIKEMIFRPLLSENLGKICWKQEKKIRRNMKIHEKCRWTTAEFDNNRTTRWNSQFFHFIKEEIEDWRTLNLFLTSMKNWKVIKSHKTTMKDGKNWKIL